MSIYQSLSGPKSLRLLCLDPGRYNQPIVCRLIETTIETTEPSYEAISYTWDDSLQQRSIICNGQSMNIRFNAYQALCTIRCTNEQRRIWLDSICINQADVREREVQVSIMLDIYQRAERVIVCLGELTYEYELAFSFISKINAEEGMLGLKEIMSPKPALSNPTPKGTVSLTPDLLRLIEHLLALPWFVRIWIQQEASVNGDTIAICGSHLLTISQVCALAWLMLWQSHQPGGHLISNQTNTAARCILAFWKNREARKTKEDLPDVLTVLYNSVHCRATDPRDFIYALQHLGWDEHLETWSPKADYTSPVAQVYTLFAISYLQRGDYHILQYAGRGNQTDPDLPSCFPQWSDTFSVFFPPSARRSWSAEGRKRGVSELQDGDPVSWTTEVLFDDTVHFIRVSFLSCDNKEAVRDVERSCWDLAKRHPIYCTGQPAAVAYWKTLTAGVEHLVQNQKPSFQLFHEWKALVIHCT